MAYSRDDIQTHYGTDRPAVNVKVRRTLEDSWQDFVRDEGPDDSFTIEWIRSNYTDEYLDRVFWTVCGWELEYLEGWATGTDGGQDALFPDDSVTIEQDGRSGGWIVVKGLPDIEEWDAVRIARWRRFERIARNIADGIMVNVLGSLYTNEWEGAKQEAEEAERAARQDIATVERTS